MKIEVHIHKNEKLSNDTKEVYQGELSSKWTQFTCNVNKLLIFPTNIFKYIKKLLLPLLTIYAAVICTLWLCPSLPRILSNDELQFDYIGAIIGILSLLITVLLGWNIYTIIDIHKIRKEFDDFRNQTIQKIDVINNDLSNKVERSLIESHRSMALMNNELENNYFLLFHYMNMLIHQSSIGLYDDCNRTIAQIITIGQIQVAQHRIDSIFQLLGQIQNANRISNYTSLVNYLSSNLIVNTKIRPSRTDGNDTNR